MSNSRKRLNRREFISTALAGAASVGLLNRLAPAKDVPGTVSPVSQSPSGNKMTERKLGKTGIVLPVVSMGVMNADNPELVKKSYELGIRHMGYLRSDDLKPACLATPAEPAASTAFPFPRGSMS